jgi:hypothetical protein
MPDQVRHDGSVPLNCRVNSLEVLMKILTVFLLLSIFLIGIVVVGCKNKTQTSDLSESSMNFDLKNLRPFLQRITPLVEEGFTNSDIESLMATVNTMKSDDQKDFEYLITHNGQKTTLKLSIVMDDIDSPDVCFFSNAALTNDIDKEMKKFATELGI